MAIRIGNAPVSWGVYEAGKPHNANWREVLDAIAKAGYAGTELGPYGYLPTSAAELGKELSARNLKLGSSYIGAFLADPSQRAKAVEQALTVGKLLASQGVKEVMMADEGSPKRKAIAGRVPKDGSEGWTAAQWKEVATTLHAIADAVKKELGMSVVVHHHAGTYIETPDEIARLLAETDAAKVNLLLDTGHCVYGGGDPLKIIQTHGSRVRYVHFKDAKPEEIKRVRETDIHMDDAWKRGVFCPLGQGVIDFKAVVGALQQTAYDGWVIVEQDIVPDANGKLAPEPFASAHESIRYLRETVGLR